MTRLKYFASLGLLWAQLNGTYYIDGTTNPGSFPTIKAALDALNIQGISGPVTFIITTGYDGNAETTPMQVLPFPGMGNYEVKLTVDATLSSVTVPTSPTSTDRFVLRLNGVKRFVIDGGRKLKFQVGSPISNTAVIGLIPTSSSTLDSVYITGCIIDGSDKATTFAGIYLGGAGSLPSNASSGPNKRITIEGNHIYGVQNGIYLRSSSSVPDSQNIVRKNKIGNDLLALSWGGANSSAGIYISGQDSILIEQDTIFNAKSPTVYGCRGIMLATISRANSRVYIRKNYIHSIEYTGTSGWQSYGMYIETPSTGPSNIYIQNNMIANIFADGWQDPGSSGNAYGIYLTGSTANAGVYIDFNSIHLYGTPATTYTNSNPACIGINGITGGLYIRSNLFQNTQTPPASSSHRTLIYGLSSGVPASVFTELDHNVYYVASDPSVSGSPIAGIAAVYGTTSTTLYEDLAAWQSFTGKDANSRVLDLPAPFVSNTDLHIPDSTQTLIEGAGMTIPSINDDFDGDPRPGNSPTPDAGCDEFNGSIPPCPSSINAGGTLTLNQDTVNRGDVVILSVSNPNDVTLPAYWQISTDGTTWSTLAPFSASNHPLYYTTTQGGKFYFRVYAKPPIHCTGLNPDSTNVDTLVVLSPRGEDASNPIPVNATCTTPDILTADLSAGWTDDYTGYGDRSGTVPDIFFRYILSDCLDSLKVNMCGSTMSDPDIVVWNTTKNQRVYTDGWSCGSSGWRPEFTLVHRNVAPGTNATVSSGATATAGMTLEANDTLLFIVMPFGSGTTTGPIELAITPYCGSATAITPTLPNDTAVCFTGAAINISISSGVTGNYTFEWYRDGQLIPGTAVLNTIQQTFNNPGTYEIVCKVLAGFCAPPGANSDTMYITVYGLPDVSIIVNNTTYPTSYDEVYVGQPPQTVTFSVDTSTSPNPSQNYYNWIIQGSSQTGAGPFTVIYNTAGRDTVILTTTYGACQESDTIVVIVGSSTALYQNSETLILYPNPSSGTLYLYSTLQGPATVQLLDLSGRIVWEKTISLSGSPVTLSVPVSDGLYQLRLSTDTGKLLQQPISILR